MTERSMKVISFHQSETSINKREMGVVAKVQEKCSKPTRNSISYSSLPFMFTLAWKLLFSSLPSYKIHPSSTTSYKLHLLWDLSSVSQSTWTHHLLRQSLRPLRQDPQGRRSSRSSEEWADLSSSRSSSSTSLCPRGGLQPGVQEWQFRFFPIYLTVWFIALRNYIKIKFSQISKESEILSWHLEKIQTTFEQMNNMRHEETKMAAGTVKNIKKVTLVCTRSYLEDRIMSLGMIDQLRLGLYTLLHSVHCTEYSVLQCTVYM